PAPPLQLRRPSARNQRKESRAQYKSDAPLSSSFLFTKTSGIKPIHPAFVTHGGERAVDGYKGESSGGEPRRHRFTHPSRIGFAKTAYDPFCLFRFCRTGTIDQHPTRPQAGSHRSKDFGLKFLVPGECRTVLPPFRLRVSTQHTYAATRGIHEYTIEQWR